MPGSEQLRAAWTREKTERRDVQVTERPTANGWETTGLGSDSGPAGARDRVPGQRDYIYVYEVGEVSGPNLRKVLEDIS
ncbi:hypothetical protein AV530_008296 [Patagioenas fasciata monilis]|uniref:Uncharacterized protein n=1 Tax=Patagioenas fasciata monilis TaxID=372326 RepID=A0A1V4KV65_PATFA|nr:hypothetical protein AV530_008296 [Patagioenas fasciata monilis]